jgi:hypothetical protein
VAFSVSQDTAANWAASSRVPALDELCMETDGLNAGKFKYGDGVNTYPNLAYSQDPTGFTPISGGWTMPANVSAVGPAAPVSGQAAFYPMDVGPGGLTPQSIGVGLTTLQVGGTGTLVKIANYADRGDGGSPLLTAAGLLIQATIDCTSTGGAVGTRLAAYTTGLKMGRYWLCAFYYQGSAAPSTPPQFTCATATDSLWAPSTAPFTVTRYLVVTGLTDLPTASQTLSGSSGAAGPIVSIRRA